MSDDPIGALVVNEIVVPVHRITLERGVFVLHASVRGPAPAVDTTSYTVHGNDGVVVYRSQGQRLRWPRLKSRDQLDLVVNAAVIDRESRPHAGPGLLSL